MTKHINVIITMTETCTGETNIKKGTTGNNVNKYNDMNHYYDD